MKYKCLVLDHDDTIVDSTVSIHYPAFLQFLDKINKNKLITLSDYFEYSFDPGFYDFCMKIMGFTEEEMELQLKEWNQYVSCHIPHVYEGMKEILWKFKEMGGYICVSSHSLKNNILRDYRENGLPVPDFVFGWDEEPNHRKPSPYALCQIMEKLHLNHKDLVMIDDLKPGKDMADCCGVDFIGAGWAHSIYSIQTYMKENCDHYFETVEELGKYLFDDCYCVKKKL